MRHHPGTCYSNMTVGEVAYAKKLDAEGKLWFFHPKCFPLPEPFGSYQPDFYVVPDSVFVEVISTRQANSFNRVKYEAFIKEYPQHKLVLENCGAWTVGERRKRVLVPKKRYIPLRPGELNKPMRKILALPTNELRSCIIRIVKDGKASTLSDVAHLVDTSPQQLWAAVYRPENSSQEWKRVVTERLQVV